MLEIIKKSLEFGLGVLNVTEEKLKEMTDEFVVKGKLTEMEGAELLRELVGKAEEGRKKIKALVDEEVRRTVHEMGMATRSDIKALEGKIDKLEALLSKKPAK